MPSIRAFPTYYSPIGKQTLTVSSSAVGLTLPTSVQVRAAIITVEHTVLAADYLRHWTTGDDPTTSEGQPLYSGDILELTNVEAINDFRAIRVTSDMKLNIQYYGGGI